MTRRHNVSHRRRLYVSGTGTEGADKSRDVDGVEEVRRVGMSASQPTTGSRERRKLPKWPGEFMELLAS